MVINSLFNQSCAPKRIQLWLGRDEVPNINWVPFQLRELCKNGLEIEFCEKTLYQYDKFLHNSRENLDKPFIIVDDDAIYPPTTIESLLRAHNKYPDAVIGLSLIHI